MSTPLKISVWDYPNSTPPKKELIVENETHWIASFNWDEGQDNPYTPTEKEARDNAQMLVAAQAMKEALEGFVHYWERTGPFKVQYDKLQDHVYKAKKALTLANGGTSE